MIPVWSDKTVLEMVFCGKYFVYMAYIHGAPVLKCIQLYSFLENPSWDTQSFDIRRDVYPRFKKLPQKYRQVSM